MKGRNGLKGHQGWSQDWGKETLVLGTLGPVCDLVSREKRLPPPLPPLHPPS